MGVGKYLSCGHRIRGVLVGAQSSCPELVEKSRRDWLSVVLGNLLRREDRRLRQFVSQRFRSAGGSLQGVDESVV